MTWQVIARKDYFESKHSKVVQYLLYFFVVVCLLGGYIFPTTAGEVTIASFAGTMTGAIGMLLPLLGILLSYNAIVGERESGRLNLLLSLPHTRRDVVFGKLMGRGVFLALGVIVGLVGAGALVVYPFGSISFSSALSYLAYIVLTMLFGAIFFNTGLAISTFTVSKRLATLAAFGVFFLFVIVWEPVQGAVNLALEQVGLIDTEVPDWLLFVYGIEPTELYDRIIAGFLENSISGQYLGPDAPWYLGEWVALVLFLLWVVVPLAIGYRRFEVTDL